MLPSPYREVEALIPHRVRAALRRLRDARGVPHREEADGGRHGRVRFTALERLSQKQIHNNKNTHKTHIHTPKNKKTRNHPPSKTTGHRSQSVPGGCMYHTAARVCINLRIIYTGGLTEEKAVGFWQVEGKHMYTIRIT